MGTIAYQIVELRDIRRFHPDASVAGRRPDHRFLGCPVDIDAATESVPIVRLQAIEPEDACHDGITTGSIRHKDLTGRFP
jgi:hypothetical protein